MKASRRAQRMRRHYQRMHRPGGLNLVSLMDIFTILVFFLMVNSSDVKVMQSQAGVVLPASDSQTPAVEALTVRVADGVIMVQGREVARLDDMTYAGDEVMSGLATELIYQRGRHSAIPELGLEVTILADRNIEYRLLRQVMQTCVDQDYRQVRLAVEAQEVISNG